MYALNTYKIEGISLGHVFLGIFLLPETEESKTNDRIELKMVHNTIQDRHSSVRQLKYIEK